MTLLNFAPENRFYDKIRDGIKIGTIRDKPKRVGDNLQLWENKRGMRKGWYCPNLHEINSEMYIGEPDGKCPICDKDMVYLPRKIAENKCTSHYTIRMHVRGDILMIVFPKTPPGFNNTLFIDARDKALHPLAEMEGFDSNRAMVEWFRKNLTDGWETKFWIRWD